jgi:hypothetical protein
LGVWHASFPAGVFTNAKQQAHAIGIAVIKWFLLSGMLGFVVYAFITA